MRRVTGEARDKIKGWESKGGIADLVAYKDSGGVLTIGWGHTGPDVHSGMRITEEKAEQLLNEDLLDAESAVNVYVKVPLTDNQFGALVSFAFNVGVAGFRSSTLLKKLNKGDYDSVPKELMKWNHDNGKVVRGLTNRRAAECGLWAKGAPVSSAYANAEARPVKSGIKLQAVGSGLAAVGAASTTVADQLQPLAEYNTYLMYGFISLTVVGIVIGAVFSVKAVNQDKATT